MVVVLAFEQRHHVGGHFDVRYVQSKGSLHRSKLETRPQDRIRWLRRCYGLKRVVGPNQSSDYLWQLLRYPNLTVWLVIDLEPDWLNSAPSMATRNNPLTSRPIEIHLRF